MTDRDKRYKSDIPEDAVESLVSPYRREGDAESYTVWPEERKYTVAGEVVGYRHYDKDGTLLRETPVRDDKKHGMEFTWEYWEDDDGPSLSLAEPYENGLMNGTAIQWASDGIQMGTYALVHGTGYDLWRDVDEHGRLYISEVHTMKDGGPHGYEWWVREDQCTVWREVHWNNGKRHGIERTWDEDKLDPGYPIFHIDDVVVDKATYIGKRKADASLPEYRAGDDGNERNFPEEVRKAMNLD